MPRDSTPPPAVAVEVALPGGRRGRIVPTTDAGQFAILCHATWIDELAATGWLDAAERDAAALVVEAFERTGLRPRLSAKYDGVHVDHTAGADAMLELMTADEMRHWRRLHKLLGLVPARHRHQLQAVVLWGSTPWCVRSLRAGLKALAGALRRPRR